MHAARPLRTALALCFLLAGCGASRTQAVPAALDDPLPWGAVAREGREPRRDLASFVALDTGSLPDANGDGRPEYHALAVSAGGSYGAFGAGFLTGWSAAGARPRFQVVTGISTGALMATSAFLGPEHDEPLRKAFTGISDASVFERRWFGAALYATALADTKPLRALIEEVFTEPLIDAVAAEHAAGRRLFAATSYLDREAFVVWDLGAIAASNDPDRVERYHDVLMASSAIPAFFPPVYFDVEIGGATYGQMHGDSGHEGSFLRPYLLHDEAFTGELDVTLHVLVNHPLDGHGTEGVPPRVLRLAFAQSMTLVSAVHLASVTRIYLLAAAQGFAFRLASIPARSSIPFQEIEFNTAGMGTLFDLGHALGLAGEAWLERPPYLEAEEIVVR